MNNVGRTITVTANAAAKSITFNGGNRNTSLAINAGITLAVGTGGVNYNGGGAQSIGTNGFPTNYTTHTLGATSTIEYRSVEQMQGFNRICSAQRMRGMSRT